MILLFDYFHTASQDLYYSLKQAGLTGSTIAINDDGFARRCDIRLFILLPNGSRSRKTSLF